MIDAGHGRCGPVEYGWAGRGLEPLASGDAYVIAASPRGCLLAVADGLGHGSEAQTAARAAVSILEKNAEEALPALFERCHQGLRHTRGVVLSAAAFDASLDRLTWLAVGNVEGTLFRVDRRRRDALTSRGGVVGDRLPVLRPTSVDVDPGDTLVMATDGVRPDYAADLDLVSSPADIAGWVLSRHGRGTDDALVVAARYWSHVS